jgi:hypothetical protein
VREIKENNNCKQEDEIIFTYSVSKYLQDTAEYLNFSDPDHYQGQ